jgi:hypothetical protein
MAATIPSGIETISARQIVLARGSSLENGATNFYALHQDAETMTATHLATPRDKNVS